MLIGSDYTAIEAVVLAVLAGEQWRVDVFNSGGGIYESSASKITGVSVAEYAAYKAEHKAHHPDRALGKYAELGSGYQGSVVAWLKFGAGEFFTPERCEPERDAWLCDPWAQANRTLQEFAIGKQVKAWRAASPKIVKFWANLQAAALAAVGGPGRYRVGAVSFMMDQGCLYCTLPSGRRLAYHKARVGPGKFGKPAVYFHRNNTSAAVGPVGWHETSTYGGKLCENVVQAVARDILVHGMLTLDAAGYPIVMHVHDEIVAEVTTGSVPEFEALMGQMPPWAAGWPVRAASGWIGRRFRK